MKFKLILFFKLDCWTLDAYLSFCSIAKNSILIFEFLKESMLINY